MLVVLALFTQPRAMAQGMMGQWTASTAAEQPSESVDQILQEITGGQSVAIVDEIDCDKVTDIQFERLGDAFMGVMHPDPEVHERMDRMMGGEGSETLRTAHISMGKNYLGCTKDIEGRWMPMMGMMGLGRGMMGSWGATSGGLFAIHLIFGYSTWILLIVLLVALIRYFWKKGGK